ncbi:hypothetical protein Tsubulata_031290, partial [Turnera subulata]
GDRFIPNRSLMDLDQAHGWLTKSTKQDNYTNSASTEAFRQRLTQSLTLDSEGRPFRMLVFRGSPKSSRKSNHLIDEMRRADMQALTDDMKQCNPRCLPKQPVKILEASRIVDDFYANTVDWGKNNILAVALGSELYLWNAENQSVVRLFRIQDNSDYVSSVAWSKDSRTLATGCTFSNVMMLWDVETSKCVRSLEGHTSRVAALAWNVRVGSQPTSRMQAHTEEVCGLKWSEGGNVLASGGNESVVYIWEASKMYSSKFLHRLSGHSAAVKALAWCPYQSNAQTMDLLRYGMHRRERICGLEWNTHHKEILTGHGYSEGEHQNKLCLWKYPSMTKVGQLSGHASRVLNLCQSPDGLTVVSAGADETLRFWEIFGPPSDEDSRLSKLDKLLSLKASPIR